MASCIRPPAFLQREANYIVRTIANEKASQTKKRECVFRLRYSCQHDELSTLVFKKAKEKGVENQIRKALRFGEQFLAKLIAHAKLSQTPIMALFQDAPPSSLRCNVTQKSGWQEVSNLYKELLHDKETKPLSELVRSTITKTGYLSVLDLDKETREEKRENVAELLSKAVEWEESHEEPSLEKFLEELTLTASLDQASTTSDRLSLMTAHNGKGLEFHVVFLVGMEEELFPHINSKESPEDLEEERRLFYVGITRAKKKLFLCHTTLRHMWGGPRSMRPSRFLQEIPFHLRQYIHK